MARAVDQAGIVRVLLACLIVGALSPILVDGVVADGEVTEAWVARYDGPVSDYEWAHAIAVDGSGNVYVTGFGNTTSFDYVTVKYDAGGSELWVARYDGEAGGFDRAYDVAVDSTENVYVTGLSEGNGTAHDYVTVKYDSDGDEVWTARYDGPGGGEDFAYALALDGADSLYVTGTSLGNGTSRDYATVKYASDGSELWAVRYDGLAGGNDEAYAIATDAQGNAYVTGTSRANGTDFDYATIRYDSAGNETWVRRYDGPATSDSDDSAQDLALDEQGNVYVTGWSRGNSTGLDFATLKYRSSGEQLWAARYHRDGYDMGDMAIVKYDAEGDELWDEHYDGPASAYDFAHGIAQDGSGDVCVTGVSEGNGTAGDYATMKYASDGTLVWAQRYDGPASGQDEAWGIAVDDWGNVHVTGRSQGVGTSYDYATIKYVQFVPGDADGDGDVDVADWTMVRQIILGEEAATQGADADQDGDVDVFDWVKVKRTILGLDT
jgi:hypothetical protein